MKKFLSVFLTLAMILSLSVPAFAAESKDVTASYTPTDTTAKITGVSITVDGTEYTSGNVTITPNTQSIIFTVSGTNFANVSADNHLTYAFGCGDSLNSGWWTIDTAANTATQDFSDYISEFGRCNNFEVTYSNGGNVEAAFVGTGIYLTYDDGIAEEDKAQITGVSITVDGVKYTSGNVTITPNTQSIIYTVSGTNFANLRADNWLTYTDGFGRRLNSGDWTIDTEVNTATRDFSNDISEFERCNNFEVTYSNDGYTTQIPTGIYLTYDDGIAEEDKAVITDVSITVDGVTYTEGTATITPDTQSIILTVTGTNLQNGTENNLVFDGTASTRLGSGNGWIISDEGTSATLDISDLKSDFETCTTATELQYTNDNMTTWINAGVYVIYQSETVSVDITWGAMSFTYSDDTAAWSCDTDANLVTVTNNGNVTVDVAVAYTAADDYTEITGTFDTASATLAENGSKVFTLTLDGKPNQALNGDKIGSVTVTISKATASAKQDVTISLVDNAKLQYYYDETPDLTTLVQNDANLPMTFTLISTTGEGSLDGTTLRNRINGVYEIQVTTAETDTYNAGTFTFEVKFIAPGSEDGGDGVIIDPNPGIDLPIDWN